jgi:hypothetical protein
MYSKGLIALTLSCATIAGSAFATVKLKKKVTMKLVTAYTRTVPEELQTNPPAAGTFIVVRWNNAKGPETMFWRGEGGWLNCNMERARKTVKAGKIEYASAGEVMPDQIKQGDTLLITPVTGGRFPIPEEIPAKAKNTLFYKTPGNAKWQSFVVSPIAKK